MADQNTSLQLFQRLVEDNPELQTTLDYAERHREVIQRFGRFPPPQSDPAAKHHPCRSRVSETTGIPVLTNYRVGPPG